MVILGIECTAHTLGIGIVNSEGQVLADSKAVYTPEEGGIHPREAAENHQKAANKVLQDAVNAANITLDQLQGIAFSQGPGLPPALRVGAVIARSLAKSLNIPLLGINHCVAHIEQARFF
ncbi:MAG: bifunctional N(6)-L-threonylcarbamoyladenine synthase/serine/threonine protein kinase, partial [Candidatus Hermodarchaeia archaeon]